MIGVVEVWSLLRDSWHSLMAAKGQDLRILRGSGCPGALLPVRMPASTGRCISALTRKGRQENCNLLKNRVLKAAQERKPLTIHLLQTAMNSFDKQLTIDPPSTPEEGEAAMCDDFWARS